MLPRARAETTCAAAGSTCAALAWALPSTGGPSGNVALRGQRTSPRLGCARGCTAAVQTLGQPSGSTVEGRRLSLGSMVLELASRRAVV